MKKYIKTTRAKGGKPILVTSMHRRSFDSLGKIINTFGDFPEAMRQTAKEENVPLIDLKRDEQNAGGGFGTEGRNGHLFMWQLILSQIQKLNSI